MTEPEYLLARVTQADAEAYADWTECAAFRFHRIDDETVEIQVTRDLDALTAPEAKP